MLPISLKKSLTLADVKNIQIMDRKIENKTVLVPAELIDYASDGIVSKEFVKNNGGGITLFAFDAGQRLSEHTAPFDAVVQVLDGTAEVIIDGQPFEVSSGNMIIMPAVHPHAVHANVRFKMMLTMIRG